MLAVVFFMQEAEALRDALKSQEKSADVASRLEMVESKFPAVLLHLGCAQTISDLSLTLWVYRQHCYRHTWDCRH
jgi:hypothetical protein